MVDKLKSNLKEILCANIKRYEKSIEYLNYTQFKYLLAWSCAWGMIRILKFIIQGAFQIDIQLVNTDTAFWVLKYWNAVIPLDK